MKKVSKLLIILAVMMLGICSNTAIAAENLNSVYEDTKGTNSWWVYPLSVDNDKYIYTSYTSGGFSGLQQYNRETGKTKRKNLLKVKKDDHNAGAVEFLDDGRLMYAVTGHGQFHYVKVFVSNKKDDITKWHSQTLVTEGTASYAQIIKMSSGYYLFTRGKIVPDQADSKEPNRWYWSVFYSKDGITWSTEKKIIWADVTQYYLKATSCTDSERIRLTMYSNPNAGQTDIRLAFFGTKKWVVVNSAGKTLYKVSDTGQGLSFFDVPIIIGKGETNQRLLDVAVSSTDKTMISYATFSDSSNATYKFALHNAKTGKTKIITIADSGNAFFSSSCYFGGMVFSSKYDSVMYLSRKIDGLWRIEQWNRKNGEYHFNKLISTSTSNLIRPFVSKNKSILQWSEGFYDASSFKKANMEIRRYKG